MLHVGILTSPEQAFAWYSQVIFLFSHLLLPRKERFLKIQRWRHSASANWCGFSDFLHKLRNQCQEERVIFFVGKQENINLILTLCSTEAGMSSHCWVTAVYVSHFQLVIWAYVVSTGDVCRERKQRRYGTICLHRLEKCLKKVLHTRGIRTVPMLRNEFYMQMWGAREHH